MALGARCAQTTPGLEPFSQGLILNCKKTDRREAAEKCSAAAADGDDLDASVAE